MRRICDVSGDGAISYSGVPVPRILENGEYFEPKKVYHIPKRNQKKCRKLFEDKDYKNLWKEIDRIFQKTPLCKGSTTSIELKDEEIVVVVTEPYQHE